MTTIGVPTIRLGSFKSQTTLSPKAAEKMCGSKHKYKSRQQAKRYMLNCIHRDETLYNKLHVYECPICRGWHMGHITIKGKKEEKES